ncbi:Phage regulatory protein Rha (pRha) [Fructobacillus fructosus]|uniref:Phage regulatory protein Rha (PRha) n=1 Tax=Fructobacillus fructosus TaxID=1631 RepID=A0ABN9YU72_9LACO|nr:Phage regulatory protein Rha (pRha) [Fructobacillus fructosus]
MELVYYKSLKDEPYTTVDVICEHTNTTRHAVNALINRYKNDLNDFGVLAFEMPKPTQGSLGGRPKKVWKLNEQQATFLITLLDNTPQVKEFKKLLVKSFYSVKAELDQERVKRQVLKLMNVSLSEVIKEFYPDSKHAYSNFHRLAFQYVTSMTPKKYKKVMQVEDPWQSLTELQRERLERVKQNIAMFIQDGDDYQDIKAKLLADI